MRYDHLNLKNVIIEGDNKETYVFNRRLTRSSALPEEILRIEVETSYDTLNVQPPLVQVSWSQGNPYNSLLCPRYCESCEQIETPMLGCCTIAVAYVLSVKKPSTINFSAGAWSGNWSELTRYRTAYDLTPYFKQQLYSLLRNISIDLNTVYNCAYSASASVSSTYKELMFLRNTMNYSQTQVISYDVNNIESSLLDGQPVLIDGQTRGSSRLGHSWVIDGCYKVRRTDKDILYRSLVDHPSYPFKEREWTIESIDEYYTDYDYLHCKIGLYSEPDGYYLGSPIGFSFNDTIHVFSNIR